MKSLANILGSCILILYWFYTILFWYGVFGAIGFFGAIITTPVSVFIAFFLTSFTSFASFFFNVLWIVIGLLLVGIGEN